MIASRAFNTSFFPYYPKFWPNGTEGIYSDTTVWYTKEDFVILKIVLNILREEFVRLKLWFEFEVGVSLFPELRNVGRFSYFWYANS